VASQSKIISGGSGGGMGAAYRGNAKKFVMNNNMQNHIVSEINSRSGQHAGPNSISGAHGNR
jgi:hypothetical protein